MTTTEEKLKAYKEGFKDGFDEGYKRGRADADLSNPYKEAIKNVPLIPQPQDWTSCTVCGKSGVRFEVCYNPRCPSRVTFTTSTTSHDMGTGAIGAAGSMSDTYPPLGSNGANGPTGN